MDFYSLLTGQSGMANAGAKIGGALFPDTQGAFQQGALKAVTLQDKLLDARKKRDEEIARAGRQDAMVAAGFTPQQAKLVDLVMGSGGGNYSQVMQGEGYRQAQGFRQSAVDAAKASGDFTDYNAPLLGLENGPVETAKVQDGNILLGMFGEEPAIFPTEQGRAKIEADQAMAAQRRAKGAADTVRAGAYAGERGAAADKHRRTDPNASRGGKGKRKVTRISL